jgi:hypothetical protein
MADDFIRPDDQLALLQEQLRITSEDRVRRDLIAKIDKRQLEIMKEQGLSNIGFGSMGSFIPGAGQGIGKTILQPTGESGVFTASKITSDTSRDPYGRQDLSIVETNDPAAKGMSNYNPNATGSKRVFFDSSGKQISASAAASSKTGQEFAAAGWDIGFGPGMIAPGVKADTTARDARIAAMESQVVQTSTSVQTQTKQPDVDPIPLTSSLLPVSNTPPPPPAKTAPIDTVLFEDSGMSIEIMTDLIFEDIGGHELLSISRNDIINGQQVSYSPIKNLGLIQQRYNPNNILKLQSTSETYFANFAIKFEEKVPLEGNGPDGANVYIEEETGDLIIETINMNNDEQIEVQIAINGTIYEANFGETVS